MNREDVEMVNIPFKEYLTLLNKCSAYKTALRSVLLTGRDYSKDYIARDALKEYGDYPEQ